MSVRLYGTWRFVRAAFSHDIPMTSFTKTRPCVELHPTFVVLLAGCQCGNIFQANLLRDRSACHLIPFNVVSMLDAFLIRVDENWSLESLITSEFHDLRSCVIICEGRAVGTRFCPNLVRYISNISWRIVSLQKFCESRFMGADTVQ